MKPFTITGWTSDGRTRTVKGPVHRKHVTTWCRRGVWTKVDDAALISLRNRGLLARFIARRLGRTTHAVFNRMEKLKAEGRL